MSKTNTRDEIIHHMSLAFFACAWADYSEQVGPHYPAGCEIMDEMPGDTDPSALRAAKDLADEMEKMNRTTLAELLKRAQRAPGGDRPCDAEHFGHYAAMQAMGHGVGLESVCDEEEANIQLPYMEFTMYDLDPERYPIPDEEDEHV